MNHARVSVLLVLVTTWSSAFAGVAFRSFNVPEGYTYTAAYGVNNAGVIVGSFVGSGGQQGYVYDPGVFFSVINPPGAWFSLVQDINDLGQMVGWSSTGAFLYSAGAYTALAFPGAERTAAFGINDLGQIVGVYDDSSMQQHGFLYSHGQYVTFDFPGSDSTLLTKINDAGQIVGGYCYSPCQSGHGFFFNGSTFFTVDYPGALGTAVYGLNNQGEMVGGYNSPETGFIYRNGTFESVDFMNNPTGLWGINDNGEIAGSWVDQNNYVHGLYSYYSITPEPGSILLWGTVMVGVFKKLCRSLLP